MKKKENEYIEFQQFKSGGMNKNSVTDQCNTYLYNAQKTRQVTGVKVTTTQSSSGGSIVSVLIRYIVPAIVVFIILKAIACTAPTQKASCSYVITSYPCTDTLVYIPITAFGDMALDDSVILTPKSYLQVAWTLGNDTFLGYTLKNETQDLCKDAPVTFMDADKVYAYHRVKPLLDRYKKLVHLNHEQKKALNQEYEVLVREFKQKL